MVIRMGINDHLVEKLWGRHDIALVEPLNVLLCHDLLVDDLLWPLLLLLLVRFIRVDLYGDSSALGLLAETYLAI